MATEIQPEEEVHEKKEKKIPVFTVLKNNTILKNIFLIDSPPSLSNSSGNSGVELEEVLVVGRHPDCNITLEHPSISRFHLRIHSIPALQSLSVLDLSSVHGTYVSGKKVEPGVRVELHEGDMLQLGGSTRVYRLHWVPLSRAYDMKNPFVPPLSESRHVDKRQGETSPHLDYDDWQRPDEGTETQGDYLEGLELFSDMNMESGPVEKRQGETSPRLDYDDWQCPDEEGTETQGYYLEGLELLFSDMNMESGPVKKRQGETIPRLDYDNRQRPDEGTETQGDYLEGLELLFSDMNMESSTRELTPPPLMTEETKPPFYFEGDKEDKSSLQENLQPSEIAEAEPVPEVGEDNGKLEWETFTCADSINNSFIPAFGESEPEEEVQKKTCSVLHGDGSTLQNGQLETPGDLLFADYYMISAEDKLTPSASPLPEDIKSVLCFEEDAENKISCAATLLQTETAQLRPAWQPNDSELQVDFASPDGQSCTQAEDVESSSVASHVTSLSIWKRRGKSASVQVQTGRSRQNRTKAVPNLEMELKSNGYNISRSHLEGLFEETDMVEKVFTPDKENCILDIFLSNRPSKQQGGEKLKPKLSLNSLLSSTDEEGEEVFTPDKENMTPKTRLLWLSSKKKIGKLDEINSPKIYRSSPLKNVGSNTYKEVCLPVASESGNHSRKLPQEMIPDGSGSSCLAKSEADILRVREDRRMPFQPLLMKSNKKTTVHRAADMDGGCKSVGNMQIRESNHPSDNSTRESKMWTMVVDTACLVNKESRKALQLMEGLHGTTLIIPRIVIRELDCMNKHCYLFRRKTGVSSALQWIKDCMENTKWWIHVQSSMEDAEPIAPTPRSWPLPEISSEEKGKFSASSSVPFSPFGNVINIVTPTTEDHILQTALFFMKTRRKGQFVLLSDDISLKIKAMAEGMLCETAEEFRESLVNPFSERFLWIDSSPRGPTWCCRDDVVLREKYYNVPSRKDLKSGEAAKGLKLILLHNSHYRRMSSVS